MTEIADAVRLHLLHCGFVDPDDNTVPIFTGNDPHFAWTSVDKLVDAMLARFDIQDPQRSPLPADETEYGVRWRPGEDVQNAGRREAQLAAEQVQRAVAMQRRVGPWIEVTQ